MPTCSQAKIITNLESDIHKRFRFINTTNQPINLNSNTNVIETFESNLNNNSELKLKQNLPQTNDLLDVRNNMTTKLSLLSDNTKLLKREHFNVLNAQKSFTNMNQYVQNEPSNSTSSLKSAKVYYKPASNANKRISIDDLNVYAVNVNENPNTNGNIQRLPIWYGDFTLRKDSTVPINFLYNSSYRQSLCLNRQQQQQLPKQFKLIGAGLKNPNQQQNSSTDENIDDEFSSSNMFYEKQIMNSKRNSIDETVNKYSIEKNAGRTSIQYANFPKLALEVDTMAGVDSIEKNKDEIPTYLVLNENEEENDEANKRNISIDQAKRLLALASIRPSKTFHKSMTDEEIEVLKKYYDLIKPKCSNQSLNNQLDLNYNKYLNCEPMTYDTGKVNQNSLNTLKSFIDNYKQQLDSGRLVIDYDQNEPKGFILKDPQNNDSTNVIKFPNDINDAFFALAVSSGDKEKKVFNEANLFRIVNWNDATVPGFNSKFNNNTKISNSPTSFSSSLLSSSSSSSSSSASSTFNFDFIKTLSNLVNSVIQPNLLNKLTQNGLDISILPGGKNFDMPTFEEMGIELNKLTTQLDQNDFNAKPITQLNVVQNPKLKNVAYKKLKEKVASSKCMWFSAPPERKPLCIMFEYAGVDNIDHETILQQTNEYLKQVNGYIECLEFVPRSVHLGSVYVENVWVLKLNDMNTKFYTLKNGIIINDQKILVKSYDEFIFTEYENFIRNEKYKQLIRNHEKSIKAKQQQQQGGKLSANNIKQTKKSN